MSKTVGALVDRGRPTKGASYVNNHNTQCHQPMSLGLSAVMRSIIHAKIRVMFNTAMGNYQQERHEEQ